MKRMTSIIYSAFALFAFACFAISPTARAVTPAPDGGYPNQNTAEGDGALQLLDIGAENTAIGFNALYHNDGNANTAIGAFALTVNTEGNNNTATGVAALEFNEAGQNNTANGVFALFACISNDNTATGFNALACNQGSYNTATGSNALAGMCGQPMPGSFNTATGFRALFSNVNGFNNTATGVDALHSNDGDYNTAIGQGALYSNTTGFNNTATGVDALRSSTTGNYCTATGQGALYSNTTGRNNTADGQNALRKNTSGSFNIALGDNAGFSLTSGSNNIDIGNKGVAAEANTIRIGKQGTQTATFIAGVSGATVPTGVAVIVDGTGHLGTTTSSARFKEAIKPMDKVSEAILALKPVTFCYTKELDPNGIPQFGLVAEQVEKVDPDLVARDSEGKPYTVRYEAVNAMLLNEFLKEHAKVEQLKKDFESKITEQQKQIEALTAGLQKVTVQIEARKHVPQIVSNNQ